MSPNQYCYSGFLEGGFLIISVAISTCITAIDIRKITIPHSLYNRLPPKRENADNRGLSFSVSQFFDFRFHLHPHRMSPWRTPQTPAACEKCNIACSIFFPILHYPLPTRPIAHYSVLSTSSVGLLVDFAKWLCP